MRHFSLALSFLEQCHAYENDGKGYQCAPFAKPFEVGYQNGYNETDEFSNC
jgi:hypothetical protein